MTDGSDERPVRRRLVSGHFGEHYVVELRRSLILIRPPRTRRGGKAEVAVPPGLLYQRLMEARVSEELKQRRKARRSH